MDKHIIQEPKVISQIINRLLSDSDQKIMVNIITIGTIDFHNGNGKGHSYMEITESESMGVKELLTDEAVEKASMLNRGLLTENRLSPESMKAAMDKVSMLPDAVRYPTPAGKRLTKDVVLSAVVNADWNQSEAARRLNVPLATFRYYLKRHNIKREDYDEKDSAGNHERVSSGVAGDQRRHQPAVRLGPKHGAGHEGIPPLQDGWDKDEDWNISSSSNFADTGNYDYCSRRIRRGLVVRGNGC